MKTITTLFITFSLLVSTQVLARDDSGEATYLGNEGVMVEHEGTKLLFDPFFHNDYGRFQLVPVKITDKIFSNTPPYDNISAVFISHAHGDHFDVNDVIKYLTLFPNVKLIGPQQAIDQILAMPLAQSIQSQLVAMQVTFEGDVVKTTLDNMVVEAAFLPHAGWPRTKDVENIAYRVTLNNEVTVIHMGDADPTAEFIGHYHDHWQAKLTHTAFPPYWFLNNEVGVTTLKTHLNAEQLIGIHAPIAVPETLKTSGQDYFVRPGEVSSLKPHHH